MYLLIGTALHYFRSDKLFYSLEFAIEQRCIAYGIANFLIGQVMRNLDGVRQKTTLKVCTHMIPYLLSYRDQTQAHLIVANSKFIQ